MTQLRDNVTGMPLWIGYLPDYREAYPLVSEQQRGLGARSDEWSSCSSGAYRLTLRRRTR